MEDLLIKDTPIPLHYQVQKYILKKIKKDEWKANEFIPTEKELGDLFKVSRITIRKALSVLENNGHIKKIRGKGTIVSGQKQKILVSQLFGLHRYCKERGVSIKSKIINSSIEKPDGLVSDKLDLSEDEEICRIERLRIIDGEPLNFSIINITKKYCPTLLDEDLENESLFMIIEKNYGLEILKSNSVFYSSLPGSRILDLLSIKEKEPLQVIENISYIDTGVPIEFSINYYRSTKILFELEVSKDEIVFGVKGEAEN